MKRPRKDRGIDQMQVAPLVALLVLLIANGQALVVTLRPVYYRHLPTALTSRRGRDTVAGLSGPTID